MPKSPWATWGIGSTPEPFCPLTTTETLDQMQQEAPHGLSRSTQAETGRGRHRRNDHTKVSGYILFLFFFFFFFLFSPTALTCKQAPGGAVVAASKYIMCIRTERSREIHKSAITVGGFNTPSSITERTSRQKPSKALEGLTEHDHQLT